ncbi:MAG TPA: NADAR family protein [Ktedonobacterales bacterium]|nr:NADAR family protein [Ktedonobacterales bacterium]
MSDPPRDLWGEPVAVIQFYSTREPYGAFSNFAAYPIVCKGLRWPTSEHYFQAQKFAGTDHEGAIRRVASPTVAARMGRSRQRPLRYDWESVKDDVMLEALRAKFTQHPTLRDLLLGTGDALIVEHTSRDAYWGDGGDGRGRNMLGRLLMRVREELRGQEQPAISAS